MVMMAIMLFVGTSCNNEDTPQDYTGVKVNIELDMQQRSIVEKGNIFANKLLLQTIEENENTLISPFSLQVVLGMLANGADEEAYKEITSTLGMQSYSEAELNGYFQKMVNAIAGEEDPKVELALANSMWIQNDYSVQDSYVSKIAENYDATVKSVNFGDLDKAKATIDDWAKEKTRSTIKELNLPIQESTKMVLANALYFSGKWAKPFNEKNTWIEDFTCEDGSVLKRSFMHGLKKNVAYMETDKYQWVSLPFGNESFSMNILLPKEGNKLADVLPDAEWNATDNATIISVDLSMPRFELNTKKEMSDALRKMGITRLFNSNSLLKIAEELYVSFVQQNSYLKIEEDGVKASTVTSSGIDTMAPEITFAEMKLNRPFAFAICENSSGAMLFMGKIARL